MRPHRWQPTRLHRSWDSQSKSTGVGCHFLLQCMKVKSESEVSQSCPTLHNSMDCSPPGSSIHGLFQARILEWDAIAFSSTTCPKSLPQYQLQSANCLSYEMDSSHIQQLICIWSSYLVPQMTEVNEIKSADISQFWCADQNHWKDVRDLKLLSEIWNINTKFRLMVQTKLHFLFLKCWN